MDLVFAICPYFLCKLYTIYFLLPPQNCPAKKATTNDLRRLINAHKLLRHNLSNTDITIEAESSRVTLYISHYLEGLALGTTLPSSELQPADDLAIMAGNVLVNLWKLTNDEKYLLNAATFLEFALTRSKQSFQARLMLIRLYRLLGTDLYIVLFGQTPYGFGPQAHLPWPWNTIAP